MNKKLLIGIVVLYAGLIIAAAILAPQWIGFLIVITLVGAWIYLVWGVRKKKTRIFHDEMEPELAESRYKMLKVFLLVAGISLAVGIVGVIVHNALHALSQVCEPVSMGITIVGLFVFIIAAFGGLVIFLRGRRKPT